MEIKEIIVIGFGIIVLILFVVYVVRYILREFEPEEEGPIDLSEIEEDLVDLYDPSGVLVGEIVSKTQLDYVCLQIKRQALGGYYLVWEDEKYEIKKDGSFDTWPPGLYQGNLDLLNELMGIL